MAEHLFETKTGRISFVIVEYEMSGVDALLSGLSNSVSHTVRDLEGQRRRIIDGERIQHGEFGDITADVLDGLEQYHLPHARYVQESLAVIARSLLLFAFFERALRVIAEDLVQNASEVKKYLKKNQRMGNIRAYIGFLQNEVTLDFTVPHAVEKMLDEERHLRNCFAHGEWDVADSVLQNVGPFNLLLAIKNLFDELETAVEARCT